MIIAIGDSITFGSVGYSYLKYMPIKVINKGINGDCVLGLYRRLKKLLNDSHYSSAETFIIEIGINDVFLQELGNVSPYWRMCYFLRPKIFGYHYCIDDTEFQEVYEKVICLLKDYHKKIILVGLPKTEFKNKELKNLNIIINQRNKLIKDIAGKYDVKFIDTYSLMEKLAVIKKGNGYAWGKLNLMRCVDSFLFLLLPPLKDLFSKMRNLNLTVDGIHFNSRTAKELAAIINKELKNFGCC